MGTETSRQVPGDDELSELAALGNRAEEGDHAALTALNERMRSYPALLEMAGDLNVLVEAELVSRIADMHPSMKEAVQAKLRSLKRDLAGDERSPSVLEDLLIERIAFSWVHLHYLELRYAAALRQESGDVDFLHRQVDRAEGRYLRAIKKLADLRRLDLPAIQVNIGGHQVNVA